jgi:hypothetical protein
MAAGVPRKAKSGRCISLGIEVDEKDRMAGSREGRRQVVAVVVFPTPPFWFAIAMTRAGVDAVLAVIAGCGWLSLRSASIMARARVRTLMMIRALGVVGR